jgi:EAL domain-containing protein (putative c-di-GMP-specific phosphodiesterase class I)
VAWVELLARWEPTPGSFVPPSVFVPLAEDIGVVGDLDRRMLAHAATALARWRTHPVLSTADIAVNISALHLARGQLDREVSELVACHDLRPERLIVEITESHRMADTASMAAMFHHLVQLGTRLAVDDFGTGVVARAAGTADLDREDRPSLTAGSVDDAPHRSSPHPPARCVARSHRAEASRRRQIEMRRSLGIDQAQGLFCPPPPLNAPRPSCCARHRAVAAVAAG